MRIRILKPGVLSTIQDLGRYHHLADAVPVSGPMDVLSSRLVNIALGNNKKAAVIEFTYSNAEFIAETDLLIAYAGDGAVLNTATGDIPPERPVYLPTGTVVKLRQNAPGSRTYLAVAGGWDVPKVLGSRSTCLIAGMDGLEGRALQHGDEVSGMNKLSAISGNILYHLQGDYPNYAAWSIARRLLLPADRKTIRVVRGNEFSWFEDKAVLGFFSTPFTLGLKCNRMGYHLEGAAIGRKINDELLSTAVTPGTIQVTGSGGMVLLMADCQTTGGYPRIAQVAAVDMPLCGQLKPGDRIYFKEISRQDAELLYLEREKQLQVLTTAVKHKYL